MPTSLQPIKKNIGLTMTTPITKEQELRAFITGFLTDPAHDEHSGSSMTEQVFRIALASLEADAVAFVMADDLKDSSIISTPAYRDYGEAMDQTVGDVVALYAAPPAPVSVLEEREAFESFMEARFKDTIDRRRVKNGDQGYFAWDMIVAWIVWQGRAAMLNHSEVDRDMVELVRTAYNLPPNSFTDAELEMMSHGDNPQANAYRELLAFRRNSPVIQDCSCRTCRPVTMTDMRFVVCQECGNKRCPHANDHRNACTGSNEPGQEGSEYPAAPQQEGM